MLILTVASASSRLLVSSASSAAFTRLQHTALTRADGVVATGEGPVTATPLIATAVQ